MVMRDIGSFHCPEPRFISRGGAEGNKLGRGVMNTACIPKLLYRYNTFVPVYLHLLSFFDHVSCKSEDYAIVRRLSLKNFCHNLVKTLSIMASRH